MLNVKFIRRRREAMGLSQEQAAVAARIGHRMHWSRLESDGGRNLLGTTLVAVANVLQCTVDELLIIPPRIRGAHQGSPAKAKKPLKNKAKVKARQAD